MTLNLPRIGAALPALHASTMKVPAVIPEVFQV
jgi:hypothetical protein